MFGATDALGSTHYLQEPSMRTDAFSFYFATRWHHICFMNKHHQMGATSTSQMYVMWYFVPVWSYWHIGQHSLPAWSKYENRCLLVFTLPLDGVTCVSWINTINQCNAKNRCNPNHLEVCIVPICICLDIGQHTRNARSNNEKKCIFSF